MNSELILRQIRQYLSLRDGECHTCKDAGRKMFMCSSCAAVSYCGAKCQRKHWAQHQLVCANGNGKGKREREDTPPPREGEDAQRRRVEPPAAPPVQFGTLPRDVIQLIVEQMSKGDALNFRLVARWLADHPRVIQNLQQNYVYTIRDLDQIRPPNPIDWTRGMQKLRYDGNDQLVVN